MHHRIIPVVVSLVALSGCGGGASRTVVVAPSASIAFLGGSRNYEYVGHEVSTTGTVRRARRGPQPSHYVLSDGAGHVLALLPASVVAKDAGRRVRVSGVFDVQFEFGPQLTVQQIQVR